MLILGKEYNTHPHFRLTVTGSQALKFLNFIYSNNEICLKRKQQIYLDAKAYFDNMPNTNKIWIKLFEVKYADVSLVTLLRSHNWSGTCCHHN